jgi:hypothetical protein
VNSSSSQARLQQGTLGQQVFPFPDDIATSFFPMIYQQFGSSSNDSSSYDSSSSSSYGARASSTMASSSSSSSSPPRPSPRLGDDPKGRQLAMFSLNYFTQSFAESVGGACGQATSAASNANRRTSSSSGGGGDSSSGSSVSSTSAAAIGTYAAGSDAATTAARTTTATTASGGGCVRYASSAEYRDWVTANVVAAQLLLPTGRPSLLRNMIAGGS